MTPFGLRTTFVPPAKRVVKQQLTEEEAIQDFNTIMNVLKEAYPSLDDAVSPEELAAFEAGFVDSLRGGISRNNFYYQLYRLQAKVHDSHFLLYPNEQRNNNQYLPRVFFGWLYNCPEPGRKRRCNRKTNRQVAVTTCLFVFVNAAAKSYFAAAKCL